MTIAKTKNKGLNMKERIDATNWREVAEYMVSKPKFGWKTKENFIKYLQEDMTDEINWLWSKDELNTTKWDNCVWNDEVNKEYKEYFELENKFDKNAIVNKEDYSLTDYELIKKYGKDWYDENCHLNLFSPKRNLSIDKLESLASLMKEGYYGFWSYEINKDTGFVTPHFHQYSTSEYSDYIHDRRKFENFEVEVGQQKSSKTQKLTM